MKLSELYAIVISFAILIIKTSGWASEDIHKTPAVDFKKMSELVPLVDYVPGPGALYADPKTVSAEPFLGYEWFHRSANAICMAPLPDIEAHGTMINSGRTAAEVKIDQNDMDYNPEHPGIEVVHYHIFQGLISHEEENR